MPPRTIIIISETAFLRQSLEGALAGSFASVRPLETIAELSPDDEWHRTVTVIDVVDVGGVVEALHQLSHHHDLHRVMLLVKSHHTLEELHPILLKVGAILPNSSTFEEIRLVACAVREGVVVLPSSLLAGVAFLQAADRKMDTQELLTEREHDVLDLVSQGFSNKLIAHSLSISDSTVRVHIRAILKKTTLKNRTEAALMGVGQLKLDGVNPQYSSTNKALARSRR